MAESVTRLRFGTYRAVQPQAPSLPLVELPHVLRLRGISRGYRAARARSRSSQTSIELSQNQVLISIRYTHEVTTLARNTTHTGLLF